MTRLKVENIYPDIFRQCREQIGLGIEQAEKKASIRNLYKIEEGKVKPTFNQLAKLASLYHVPQWVFLREELPNQYKFTTSIHAFRQFANSTSAFGDYKVRAVNASVARFRELILEFRKDMGEPIPPFMPPAWKSNILELSRSVRNWLGCPETAHYGFQGWKKLIENQNIFIFMTSKYSSWSKVDPSLFRGICIYEDILPIIVINDSDAYKAQSFTLFHELGHLLKKQSVFDEGDTIDESESEKWCDSFAGEVLMPSAIFLKEATRPLAGNKQAQLYQIGKVAKKFFVSKYACVVRMRHLNIISQSSYVQIVSWLKEDYQQSQDAQRDKKTPISRNIAKETLNQYGGIYSRAVIQAYRDQEIGLHKLCKLLSIKKAATALKLEDLL